MPAHLTEYFCLSLFCKNKLKIKNADISDKHRSHGPKAMELRVASE